jgi:hypothetical protein
MWKLFTGMALFGVLEWAVARGWGPLTVCCASGLLILAWLVIDPGVVQPDEDHPD